MGSRTVRRYLRGASDLLRLPVCRAAGFAAGLRLSCAVRGRELPVWLAFAGCLRPALACGFFAAAGRDDEDLADPEVREVEVEDLRPEAAAGRRLGSRCVTAAPFRCFLLRTDRTVASSWPARGPEWASGSAPERGLPRSGTASRHP